MPARKLADGIGVAVAKRTILRKKKNGHLETWKNVADRVALGNSLLTHNIETMNDDEKSEHQGEEYEILKEHIGNATLLMSGRHLQHGDETQPERNQEVFTNCSTSASSFLLFYLLMNGSGVGRAYDDDMMLVDWSEHMPNIRVVLNSSHPNFDFETMETPEIAKKKYKNVEWFEVPDTREGWAQAVEKLETMTYKFPRRWLKNHENSEINISSGTVLVIDFSKVRAQGAPIKGMQDRPASGPVPLMRAFNNIATIKSSKMSKWESTLWVDHYLAECVLVGGARRSARIATKNWSDEGVIDFIGVKEGGILWSANNSVTVDEEFWKQDNPEKKAILKRILKASYDDGTGEPGFINQHKLIQKDDGIEIYDDGKFAESNKYKPSESATEYLTDLAKKALSKKYTQIVNPCGEITLHLLGGYCVIADVVPYFANDDDDAEDAFRSVTRALIRVNTMDSLYKKEVERTNRIGVGLTGIFEYAWKRFGYGWSDLIDESKSMDFWLMLSRFKRAVDDESIKYSNLINVNIPHTNTTIKPAGTTSKLFSLSEGAHLPAMREYVRWVQFRGNDPLIKEYEAKGYPTKKLKTYKDVVIVGFPTQPEICKLGMGEKLVTAGEATPEEQYKWLMLLEKYWMTGVENILLDEDEDLMGKCYTPLKTETGNQISYTLKYNPKIVDYASYSKTIRKYQPLVRCCSVLPDADDMVFEYLPEQRVSRSYFNQLVRSIEYNGLKEDVDKVHVDCGSGGCPIEFEKEEI